VHGIVEKHGGTIRMVSEPELGTTFWFDLPLEDSDADELLLLSERKAQQLLSRGST
jgi:two-component system sensor histidine kinase NblS